MPQVALPDLSSVRQSQTRLLAKKGGDRFRIEVDGLRPLLSLIGRFGETEPHHRQAASEFVRCRHAIDQVAENPLRLDEQRLRFFRLFDFDVKVPDRVQRHR